MLLVARNSESGALSEILLFRELGSDGGVVDAYVEHVESRCVLTIVASYVCTVVPSLHYYGDAVQLRVSWVKNVPRHVELKLVPRRTSRTLP
jgi:hypothetical protein